MLLKKHKHPFLFTKDEMVQERVDDDTGEAQSTDRGKKKMPFTCLTAKNHFLFRLGTAYLWCFIFFYIR
jgi:hypothetical protein